ncbi:MAG: 6,7-dimethyl-8-ribityllumazine synthase [Actinobacteria bacterium]|nr:6,7-dimethyl-8-ribityllumazine synthase [Actinomycetota bacterium]
MHVHEGALDGSGLKVALVAARFNESVVDRLVAGAADCLRRHDVASDDIELVRVPGAWEVPLVVKRLALAGRYAIVALGAVVRGETAHFDYVAGQAALVGTIVVETATVVTNAVLTTETYDQAVDRAGGKHGNEGFEAALAAIETANLLRDLK